MMKILKFLLYAMYCIILELQTSEKLTGYIIGRILANTSSEDLQVSTPVIGKMLLLASVQTIAHQL